MLGATEELKWLHVRVSGRDVRTGRTGAKVGSAFPRSRETRAETSQATPGIGPAVKGRSVLHERTLVLNKHWTAVTTTTVRTALVLLYRETARVICPDTYQVFDLDAWIGRSMARQDRVEPPTAIFTPRFRIQKPEVILLREYGGRPRREVTFSRKNLYRRDNYACQYCGVRMPTEELSIDHVIPKSRGGKTAWDNCVLACIRCNTKKANKTLREVGFQLISKPEKPRWSPFEEVGRRERPMSWEKFISEEYWNSELED